MSRNSPLARPLFVGPATGGGLAATFSLADKAVGSARIAGICMDEVNELLISSITRAILIGDLQAHKRRGLTLILFFSSIWQRARGELKFVCYKESSIFL